MTGFDPVQSPPTQAYFVSHLFVAVHAEPQVPQLAMLVCVFTHAEPQRLGKPVILHWATQLPPLLHASVPFVGRAGHATHLLPHCISVGLQEPHTPAAQLVPGQALPQVPQLFGSVKRSTSQPFAAL